MITFRQVPGCKHRHTKLGSFSVWQLYNHRGVDPIDSLRNSSDTQTEEACARRLQNKNLEMLKRKIIEEDTRKWTDLPLVCNKKKKNDNCEICIEAQKALDRPKQS